MKIIVTNSGYFWNIEMKYLQDNLDKVILANYTYHPEKEESIVPNQYNFEDELCCGSPTPGYNSYNYRNTADHVDDFCEKMLVLGEDIVFLADTSLETLYLFRAMSEKAADYKIHLIFIRRKTGDEYNSFFMNRVGDRRQMQNELLFVKNLKSVVCIPEGCEEEIDPSAFIESMVNEIEHLNGGQTFIYNYATSNYQIEKMIMKNIDKSGNAWGDKKIACVIDGMVLHPENEDEPEIEELRPDGKFACSILKKMRMGLVKANGLDVEIKECYYDGPCSGTCPQCESEMREIEKQMASIPEELRIYPGYDVEDEVLKSRKDGNDFDE